LASKASATVPATMSGTTPSATAFVSYGKVLHYVECKGVVQMDSALSIKGQATIPKAIRDHLHLKPGDRIKFFLHPDGTVVILPKIPASKLKGTVRARRRVSLNDMEAAIGDGAVDDIQRRRR
jgi:antitoxin PrlF